MENLERNYPIDKSSLRRYLERFDLKDSSNLEMRSKEIMVFTRKILAPYVTGERGNPLKEYYSPCLKLIEKAYKNRDFEKEFPFAIDFIISSVEWE